LAVAGFLLSFRFAGLIFSGKWSNETGKETLLAYLFQHRTANELEALGEDFCEQKLPALLRPDLLEQLRAARRMGDTVAIVSASVSIWLQPFCRAEGFDLICTELEFDKEDGDGPLRFSGRLATPNCNGAEKARRILAAYDLSSFAKTIAYGNSRGDAAMFELADKVFRF